MSSVEEAAITEKSGGVFGAVIVKDNEDQFAEGYNEVEQKLIIPLGMQKCRRSVKHAKNWVRRILKGVFSIPVQNVAPCALATAYWAHIDHIFYGSDGDDALKYGDFQDTDIFDEIVKIQKDRKIKFTEMMRPEAVEIWKEFSQLPDRARY